MNKQKNKTFVCGFLLLSILSLPASCNRQSSDLRKALALAGENRPEFKRALEYYKRNPADSLKLKAAIFLIENMPGHYSHKNADLLNAYYDEMDRATDSLSKVVMENISAGYAGDESRETIEDIHLLKARHIVDHVERSFEVWEQGEWATHLPFDDFCEYILPYKGAELQAIDNWREYAKDLFRGELDTLHYCDLYKNSAYWAASAVNNEIIKSNRQPYPYGGINCLPILRIESLAKLPFGSCEDYAVLSLAVMRSKGIPVVIDFTPQWPFRSQGHSWTVVLTNKGKNMEFPAGFANPGEPHKPDEKKAKVFRRCYAVNKDIKAIHSSEKHVPYPFDYPFIKDVTDEYITTCDVELDVPAKFGRSFKYAYLTVFDNKTWAPVHYGKIKGGKVVFNKMGKNCMYLPVCYDRQGIVPFSAPFVIDYQGKVKRYEGDKKRLDAITVHRKYFTATHCYNVGHRLLGGKFQAANREDFSDSVTFYRVTDFTVHSQKIMLDTMKTGYRYWRYYSAEGQHCNISEIYFYRKDTDKAVYGSVIGTDSATIPDNRNYWKEAAFDRNPLTYFDAPAPSDSWVGMDFGEPVKIDKIWYTPRSDGNDVTPGDMHELLYWDVNGWISLGEKEASEPELIYNNVPANGLYWIRNLSKGEEERIFTCENGKQKWW
jgi:hypothetical protein